MVAGPVLVADGLKSTRMPSEYEVGVCGSVTT
jgi:hypothetical protein